ncbi:MAG: hypothetical protein ACJ8DJ_04780 [Gemmatimonadales bacterium]
MPRFDGSRHRAPSRYTLACLALCGALLLVAAVDLARTDSRLPEISTPGCQPGHSACFNAELSERLARDRAAEPLQRQYDSRAWLYAFALLAIAAVLTIYGLRANPRREWARIFTNLGIAGVWVGIAGVLVLLATDGNSLTVPPGPLLLLPVVLLIAAVTGTLMARSEGWVEQSQADGVRERVIHLGRLAIHIGTAGQAKRSRMEELARLLSGAALALTVLTCLFALLFVLVQPAGEGCNPPAWTDVIESVAAVTAIGAMAAGVGALLLRHWVAAVVSLAACPLALLLVLRSTCFFD